MAMQRAYWIAHFLDGSTSTEISLEEKLMLSGDRRSAWDTINKKGITSLELRCPNGAMVTIPRRGKETQFFQFKFGESRPQVSDVPMLWALVIGAVVNDRGDAIMAVWDYRAGHVFLMHENVVKGIEWEHIGPINLKLQDIELPPPGEGEQ